MGGYSLVEPPIYLILSFILDFRGGEAGSFFEHRF